MFVLDNQIIPNPRRDNFEKNSNYETLIGLLEPMGAALSSLVNSSAAPTKLKPSESQLKGAKTRIIDRINQIYQPDNTAVKQQGQQADGQSGTTKYRILNLTARLTVPEQKLVERVLDILIEACSEQELFKLIGPLLSGLDVI